MLNKEIDDKKRNVDNAFNHLLNSIASVNQTIMSTSSEELSKGNLEEAQQYIEKSNLLINFTKELSNVRKIWDNLFGETTDIHESDIQNYTPENSFSSQLPSVETPSVKERYTYTNLDITMEFVNPAGGVYNFRMDKSIFREVCKYTIQYIEKNGYAQAKDIVTNLHPYLSSNTKYKDLKSLVYKPLKFLADIGILKYRNGRTGCYELPGTTQVALDFLDNFDKPKK
ncbi:MAG: hypothetical protein GX323_09065 [Clostridiales bacterium]|nr:hypothetical protein [Clostridiales bacterium]